MINKFKEVWPKNLNGEKGEGIWSTGTWKNKE